MIEIRIKTYGFFKALYPENDFKLILNDGSKVKDVVDRLKETSREEIPDVPMYFALNNTFVQDDAPLSHGDILYILPPIGGG